MAEGRAEGLPLCRTVRKEQTAPVTPHQRTPHCSAANGQRRAGGWPVDDAAYHHPTASGTAVEPQTNSPGPQVLLNENTPIAQP